MRNFLWFALGVFGILCFLAQVFSPIWGARFYDDPGILSVPYRYFVHLHGQQGAFFLFYVFPLFIGLAGIYFYMKPDPPGR